jgi:hypothetical protein
MLLITTRMRHTFRGWRQMHVINGSFAVLMIVHNAGLHNAVHLFSKRDNVMCMHAC